RSAFLMGVLATAIPACGSDSSPATPDSPTGNHPPPRIIPGGGIGDGAVDGVVNLYVIDDQSRLPIGNASVQVGSVSGTTGGTGLYVAQGVTGPQTIAVQAASYKSVVWIGANGANATIDMTLSNDPQVTKADLAGAIIGFNTITPAVGHHKTA